MPLRFFRLALLVALAGLPAEAHGQGLSLSGGDVDLVIPVTGTVFGTAVDESTRLDWTPDRDNHLKVTVQTDATTQRFVLTIDALAPTRSVSLGPVALQAGMFAEDLVIDIKKARGQPHRDPGGAGLRYEASPPPGTVPPAGVDVHQITYTITAQ